MSAPLSKEEQFKILETSNPLLTSNPINELVASELGGSWNRKGELFTFTPSEFQAWCDRQDITQYHIRTEADTADGLYLIKDDTVYVLYSQEREIIEETERFSDELQAKRAALYQCLAFTLGYKKGLL